MNLKDVIAKKDIHLHLSSTTKLSVIKELTALFDSEAISSCEQIYHDAVLREEEITTGIGNGVAIPHAKSEAAKKATLIFGRSISPIDFNALDNKPVNIFFMIVIPKKDANLHLEILALISRVLMDEKKVSILKNSTDVDEIYTLLTK